MGLGGNDDCGLKEPRKEVVLQVAVAAASARTVVAAWVSRARREVEAVRESYAHIGEAWCQEVAHDS